MPLKYFLLIMLLAPVSAFAQGHWTRLPSPVTAKLRCVRFVDSRTGWAAGDSGVIIKTDDSGKTWRTLPRPVHSDIIGMHFISSNRGWALTWRSLGASFQSSIMSTTNGGESWDVVDYREPNILISAVFFIDSLNGFIGGSSGLFAKCTDGGSDWMQMSVDSMGISNFPVLHINFLNPRVGYAAGGYIDIAGFLYRTSDGGNTWIGKLISAEPVWATEIFDSLTAIGIGGDFEFGTSISSTTNGGISWAYKTLDVFGVGSAISFRTRDEGWAAVRDQKTLLFSSDRGENWQPVIPPDSADIQDLCFADSLTGIGVGTDGAIIRYVNAPVGIKDNQRGTAKSIMLEQNFPNPFNAATSIGFSIAEEQPLSLTVYDMLGRLVAVIFSGVRQPGSYKVRLSDEINHYRSGVYFYVLRSGKTAIRKKMIVLR